MTAGTPCYLLLHGLGATGAVWAPVAALLAERGARSVAPDLPGHGGAAWTRPYTVAGIAAQLAAGIAADRELYVVGHSFGGYVALALASGERGVRPRGVLTVGTKLSFSDEESKRAVEFARRPARIFATPGEAEERYRKVSGLDATIAPGASLIARGTVSDGAGYRLAADPQTAAIEVPGFAALLAAARCPVVAARGEHDSLVSSAELHAVVPDAIDVPGVGHNLHVEAPTALLELIDRQRIGRR